MSSPDAPPAELPGQDAAPVPAEAPDRLPPALSSMWRLCRLGFRYEPALMGVAFVLALVAALPDALLAVWFKLLGEGLIENKPDLLRFAAAARGQVRTSKVTSSSPSSGVPSANRCACSENIVQ